MAVLIRKIKIDHQTCWYDIFRQSRLKVPEFQPQKKEKLTPPLQASVPLKQVGLFHHCYRVLGAPYPKNNMGWHHPRSPIGPSRNLWETSHPWQSMAIAPGNPCVFRNSLLGCDKGRTCSYCHLAWRCGDANKTPEISMAACLKIWYPQHFWDMEIPGKWDNMINIVNNMIWINITWYQLRQPWDDGSEWINGRSRVEAFQVTQRVPQIVGLVTAYLTLTRPGKHTKNRWKDPPFSMGKSTISLFLWSFSIARKL